MSPATLERMRSEAEKKLVKNKKNIVAPHAGQRDDMITSTLMFGKHYQVSLMVALSTLGTVGALGYLGYTLDAFLVTNNTFLVIGILISFPLSQFILYKWIKERYIPRVKAIDKKLK
jgi:F0F1-type ATP synthase assembly protein I